MSQRFYPITSNITPVKYQISIGISCSQILRKKEQGFLPNSNIDNGDIVNIGWVVQP